jgi:hypothetical protein
MRMTIPHHKEKKRKDKRRHEKTKREEKEMIG